MTPHPEPPKGCLFFVHCQIDGWMFVIPQRAPYKFGMRLNVASPAERYAAACVALDWMQPEPKFSSFEEREAYFSKQVDWENVRDAARAEMEAADAQKQG